MTIANGVNHLALCTKDIKKQIQFFSEVCGMELLGLFYLHAGEGALHCFLKLNDQCFMSFVQAPGSEDKEPVPGVSYPEKLTATSAPGAFHHVSFNVGTLAELLALRDRIRKAGYQVLGTIDHGIQKSMYLNAPEKIVIEFTSDEGSDPLTPEMWVNPECAESCGITAEELERYQNPPALEISDGTAPNPKDPKIPLTILPKPMADELLSLSDDEFGEKMNYSIAPNAENEPSEENGGRTKQIGPTL